VSNEWALHGVAVSRGTRRVKDQASRTAWPTSDTGSAACRRRLTMKRRSAILFDGRKWWLQHASRDLHASLQGPLLGEGPLLPGSAVLHRQKKPGGSCGRGTR